MFELSCPCPLCGEHAKRIHRRFIDRLISIFTPVQRYQCQNFSCSWKGNIRVDHITDATQHKRGKKHRFNEPSINTSIYND